jgi:serine/threonine protein kinase
MTPERWQQVGDLFSRALDEPDETRRTWLAAVEVPDDVRAEVEALLAAHGSASTFLETPAAHADSGDGGGAVGDSRLVPGATLGAYRLIRVLGAGGMGVVFEAEDSRLHRRVALKAVTAKRAGDLAQQQRLRQEARAAAALVHPNIATVYALEEIDGHTYIASEMLEGETLRAVLMRGPLPREDALDVASAVASALEAAHARGIVHRDLKPENVLRLTDGRVKVLDFGLARFLGEARDLASVSRLTLDGLIAGTPGYMAPEQLQGLDLDGRADQFALGVLVAEMLLGANPFDAGTIAATIGRVVASDGLPDEAVRRLPPDLAGVVQRLVRVRPEDRFSITSEAVAAIAACRQGVAASTLSTSSRRSMPLSSSALLDPDTGRRPALWWWRFHQAASAAVNWMMVVPAWMVHRDSSLGLRWFLACLAATIVSANVRLHLRFSAAVIPQQLAAQRDKTRGWVALADWALIALWAYAGVALTDARREWAVVFFAFAVGSALAVALIEPATTKAALE